MNSRNPIGAALAAVALLSLANAANAFDYKLSGQVNRLITSVDDGTQSRLFHADNVNSQTRFRFTGAHEFRPGLKAGINWEVGYTSNPSSGISMANRSVDATFNERHAEVFLESAWGKASFGQGDGAANGGMEVDLSGTSVINYSSQTDIGGAFVFRNSAGGAGPTIAATMSNLDFESRYDRVRYDTPKLGPVSFSVSFGDKGNNDVWETAAWLNTDFAGGRVAGALGWSRERKGGLARNEDTFGGSVSFLARNGFNVTLAGGTSEDDNPASVKKKYAYGKLGYLAGKHAVSVDYGRGEDFALVGDSSKALGLGYVYAAEKWLDLYGGVKQHRLDRAAASFEDIRFVTAGLRLKF